MADDVNTMESANAGAAAGLPFPVVIPPEGPPPASYWDLVTHQFKKNRYAYFSFWIILGLFFIAAWAPVLANGKPFVWTTNGQTSYPLIQYLVAKPGPLRSNFPQDIERRLPVQLTALFATITIPLALLDWPSGTHSAATRKSFASGR